MQVKPTCHHIQQPTRKSSYNKKKTPTNKKKKDRTDIFRNQSMTLM